MTSERYGLAIYIGPDKTVKDAAAMISELFKLDLTAVPFDWGDLDEDGLSLIIEYDGKDTEAIREKVAELGFIEDWDTMSEWECDEEEEGYE